MPTPPSDLDWLAAAARLGQRGRPLSRPNPSVGAIIVKNGQVMGRGWTQAGGRPHAEAVALENAGATARGATLYVSLEPCAHPSKRGPTCSEIAAEAGIARVVYGLEDPDERTSGSGAEILRKAGVNVALVPSEWARESLSGYLSNTLANRPFVTLKLAMSMDGYIARSDGESQWITGEIARAHVHSRRAKSDAILVGGGTWRKDAPRLDVRLPGLEDRSPLKVLLTRGVPPDDVKVINHPSQISQLDGVQYLYVEGGGKTAASFLREDLVDRIELYRAPILLGSGIPALDDFGLESLADAHGRWKMIECRALGSDTYEAYERCPSPPPAGE